MATSTKILIEQIELLNKQVNDLLVWREESSKSKLPELSPMLPEKSSPPITAALSSNLVKEFGESELVPSNYRELVDRLLNKNFGIHMRYHNELPQFSFTIIVPEKYSTQSAEYRAMNGSDIRLRVIENSLGLNGVREWIETVYKSFDSDRQALITSDRLSTK